MDREDLADFLRRRRESLSPDDVGLPAGRRRRTAGLRREEVAGLAAMSTDFYARIEQRRGSRPSEATVAALARALRLTLDERDHLFHLAGYEPPARGIRSDHVSPPLLRILDHIEAPAQVTPGPRRDPGPERGRGGAARRPDPLRGAGPQPLLPLVHRPGRARALPGGG